MLELLSCSSHTLPKVYSDMAHDGCHRIWKSEAYWPIGKNNLGRSGDLWSEVSPLEALAVMGESRSPAAPDDDTNGESNA